MSQHSQSPLLEALPGDITAQDVDVIVNAANSALSGGGGVDGAIHRAAGPQLLQACLQLGRCPPGSAVVTPGFALKARHIIHAVGPVWRGGDHNEAGDLAACYRKSVQLADTLNAISIAFPAISCGAYRFPLPQAAEIAVKTVLASLTDAPSLRLVRFICFEERVLHAFRNALSRLQ